MDRRANTATDFWYTAMPTRRRSPCESFDTLMNPAPVDAVASVQSVGSFSLQYRINERAVQYTRPL